MSNLLEYAEKELRLAGMYDEDCDYGPGVIAEQVIYLLKGVAIGGHSGASQDLTLFIFDKLVKYKPLSPLTDNTEEWMDVDGKTLLQSCRDPACFSNDGGKTYYDIDANDNRTLKNTKPHK